ncbi:3-hydroxyacyl-CoA dehydrogenase family protein [Sphingomonas canadensis]|uniref:3-hydroxyacyl-CoA dehydrogenase family protein n=1 Tax=Sphingomonas canadensis TaxID=1219257 RepID=A0ABW3H734_9SPHN|nr:3-hydroxyacyl-CoA dehydrogenase family protein [Sphingomonas canadensis]MCW3836200.1 3-hydroxyacyl-CoA dehydrogenase family protein [Sphingomonas canadensis]
MAEPRIAVIGGGLMGVGIAQVFASAGHEVAVHEPFDQVRATVAERLRADLELAGGDPAAAARVTVTADIAEAVASAAFVTEAAPERIEIKRAIFAGLIAHAPRNAILASNSSVMPIGSIAAGLDTADRIVGTHWWNPAPLIPLVEVIQGSHTSDETVTITMALLESIGKAPAHVRKDVPGFVANRLQHALWREAIAMVADGVCDARTLDHCVKNSFGMRLPVLGPLENADLVGLDLTLDIHRTIIPELDRSAGPHPHLAALVAAGRLGFKSGEGFRPWTDAEKAELRADLAAHLVKAQRERAAK